MPVNGRKRGLRSSVGIGYGTGPLNVHLSQLRLLKMVPVGEVGSSQALNWFGKGEGVGSK